MRRNLQGKGKTCRLFLHLKQKREDRYDETVQKNIGEEPTTPDTKRSLDVKANFSVGCGKLDFLPLNEQAATSKRICAVFLIIAIQ